MNSRLDVKYYRIAKIIAGIQNPKIMQMKFQVLVDRWITKAPDWREFDNLYGRKIGRSWPTLAK